MNDLVEIHFPFSSSKPTKNKNPLKPWMTISLVESRKKKHKLAAKKIKNPTPENIKEYQDFNNIYNKLRRKVKNEYYLLKFKYLEKNIKETWDTIRSVLGESRKQNKIPDFFLDENVCVTGDLSIAEGFNKFFSEIGPKLSANIPDVNATFKDFLGEEQTEQFVFKPLTPKDILEVGKTLKAKNSTGVDGLSGKILKEILPDIINPVCHLFNLSLHTGYLPPELKTARVVPIFKSGNEHSYDNYRPISLLPSLSKLLEKVVAKQMLSYLNKHDILYKLQFGFRKGHDTSQPVIHFLNNIQEALNKNIPEYTVGCFLDLKKAFDTANHNILLQKMHHYGFRGISLTWFKNYLLDRTQVVNVNGTDSSPRNISVGVPQGSVLGPLLFLLLINDLPNSVNLLKVLLFADDTTLQASGSNLEALYKTINDQLTQAAVWFTCNKMTLNISKTKYIVFRTNNMPLNPSLNLSIGDKLIERIGEDCITTSFKFVGHVLDEFLAWKHHIVSVKRKIACANFKIMQVKKMSSN